MSDPAVEAAQRAWQVGNNMPTVPTKQDMSEYIAAAREALKPIRELHKPRWENCINACCSGEQCKHRTRRCEAGCDEWVNDNHDYWPCATAKLIYTSEELGRG